MAKGLGGKGRESCTLKNTQIKLERIAISNSVVWVGLTEVTSEQNLTPGLSNGFYLLGTYSEQNSLSLYCLYSSGGR